MLVRVWRKGSPWTTVGGNVNRYSHYGKQYVCACMRAQSSLILATPWTAAHQAPLSTEFSWNNIGMDCYFLLQEIFSTQDQTCRFEFPALPGRLFTHSATWEAQKTVWSVFRKKKKINIKNWITIWPSKPLLDIYPKEKKSLSWSNICIPLLLQHY